MTEVEKFMLKVQALADTGFESLTDDELMAEAVRLGFPDTNCSRLNAEQQERLFRVVAEVNFRGGKVQALPPVQ